MRFTTIIPSIMGMYFAVLFFSRTFVPHIKRISAPNEINGDFIETVINESERFPKDHQFIKALMDILKGRYITIRYQSFLMPWILFRRDIDKIWQQKGLNQACNVLNFLLKSMLVKSGRFSESDIKEKRFSIHQYLEIHMKDGSAIYADPWGYISNRSDLGEHAIGINMTRGKKLKLD